MISFKGYNMVNAENNLNLKEITHGVFDQMYSKNYCFNADIVEEINYTAGCHVSKPIGEVFYSHKEYPCYHYKFISEDFMISRYERNKLRASEHNKKMGMGSQYFKTKQQIISDFSIARKQAKKLIESSLKLFVLAVTKSQFKYSDELNYLHKVDLSTCIKGKLQDNRLSEHRLFLSDIVGHSTEEYLGIVTWRWYDKCKHLIPLEQIPSLKFEKNVVWAAWTDKDWYSHSCKYHKGIKPYLDELAAYTGLELKGAGAYGNQFIMHRDLFLEFQEFFRKTFKHFHKKYGLDGYNFYVVPHHQNRIPACFYERFICIWLSNRKDLIIKQIPTLH